MLSFWEQQSFLTYDHIVIGAGIVGLSTAIELRDALGPEPRILVLERALLPTGASSRNAGFACMGSATELLDDLQTTPSAEVVSLFERRKQGLEKLRARLSDQAIGYSAEGSYELIDEADLGVFDQLRVLNDMLAPVAAGPAFSDASHLLPGFRFGPKVKGLVSNNLEGAINTGHMLRALTDMAISKAIEIRTGAEVRRFHEQGSHVEVVVGDPFRDEQLGFRSQTVCICTNAFAKQLLPNALLSPGRGQILITEPIPSLPFKGIFHFEQGYFYFRELEGRILFGGGRNIDLAGEATTEFGLTETIQQALEEHLRTTIIPGIPFTIAQRWSGIMAFGDTKSPIVGSFSYRTFGAFRMGGMGVALGSLAAAEVASLIVEKFA